MRSALPRRRVVALAAVLAPLLACGDGTGLTGISERSERASQGRAGTTLTAVKTATGFHERRTEYDWSLEKRVRKIYGEPMELLPSTETAHLSSGRSIWIYYELEATKTALPATVVTGVRGTVCVSNGGERATEGLAITDVVQSKTGSGPFTDLVSTPVDVSAQPVLQPGETGCYAYEITFDAQSGTQYRNTARVTITNHSGSLGTPSGPGMNGDGVKADFTIPSAVTASTIDGSAFIDDGMHASYASRWWESGACAEHFYLMMCGSADDAGYWRVSNSEKVQFIADMQNRLACGETMRVTNVATLTESGAPGRAPQVRVDSATVLITTDPCSAPDQCVRPAAWWQSLDNAWPGLTPDEHRTVRHWPFFNTGKSWQQILDAPAAADDAFHALARQYVAATLNFGKGVDAAPAVREARANAARYFSESLDKRAAVGDATLRQWTDLLRRFNDGQLGVPACAGT